MYQIGDGVKTFREYVQSRTGESKRITDGLFRELCNYLDKKDGAVQKILQKSDVNEFKKSREYADAHFYLATKVEGFRKGFSATHALGYFFRIVLDFKKLTEKEKKIVEYMQEVGAVKKLYLPERSGVPRYDTNWLVDKLKEKNILVETEINDAHIIHLPMVSEEDLGYALLETKFGALPQYSATKRNIARLSRNNL